MYPNKVSIANNKGFESITAISRAFEVGTPAEDVVLSKYTLIPDDKRAFLIIPLIAGTLQFTCSPGYDTGRDGRGQGNHLSLSFDG